MTLTHFAIIAVCAYLLGSLSFAIIVSKLTLGKDIRNYGSGNAGLTNAYRTMGAKKTLLVLLGDIAKGAAAVSIGMLLAARACSSVRSCSRFSTGAYSASRLCCSCCRSS